MQAVIQSAGPPPTPATRFRAPASIVSDAAPDEPMQEGEPHPARGLQPGKGPPASSFFRPI
jgi:hypothetical protein